MIDTYAVVGNPVHHSLSPEIHALFANQFDETIEYKRILSDERDFEVTLNRFFDTGGKGLNITMPFKQKAARWVDLLTDEARSAGAVNTISREGDRSTGHNTDGLGLVRDLTTGHGLSLSGLNTLIIGAGGATRGIVGPLLNAGAKISIANRTISKASRLVKDLCASGLFEEEEVLVLGLENSEGCYDLVLNATSAGALGEGLELPEVCAGAYCYDLFYRLGGRTPFCEMADTQKALRVADGLGMLVEQAAEAYMIWRGQRPETAPVISKLRASF